MLRLPQVTKNDAFCAHTLHQLRAAGSISRLFVGSILLSFAPSQVRFAVERREGCMLTLCSPPTTIGFVPFLNARSGGGVARVRLPIEVMQVRGLPTSCAGIVCTSDLQGVTPSDGSLLGIGVVTQLQLLAAEGRLPDLAQCGALLAGDLYSEPHAASRGGFGDVSTVWQAFQSAFKWVLGVAGNHDDVSRVEAGLLDGDVASRAGLTIGGVGLIGGAAHKRGRRAPELQRRLLEQVLEDEPDFIVLHEGPRGDDDQPGVADFTELLDGWNTLVVCGHTHWARAVHQSGARQFINVDGRVLVLLRTA